MEENKPSAPRGRLRLWCLWHQLNCIPAKRGSAVFRAPGVTRGGPTVSSSARNRLTRQALLFPDLMVEGEKPCSQKSRDRNGRTRTPSSSGSHGARAVGTSGQRQDVVFPVSLAGGVTGCHHHRVQTAEGDCERSEDFPFPNPGAPEHCRLNHRLGGISHPN